jgi:hypothetical protein
LQQSTSIPVLRAADAAVVAVECAAVAVAECVPAVECAAVGSAPAVRET